MVRFGGEGWSRFGWHQALAPARGAAAEPGLGGDLLLGRGGCGEGEELI